MRLVAALGIVACVIFAPRPSEACSCRRAEACEELARATAVFVGTAAQTVDPGIGLDRTTTFAVTRVLAGTLGESVELATAGHGCGSTFIEGETYLVYAMERDGRLYTSMCTRTRPLQHAKEDPALGSPSVTKARVRGVVTVFADGKNLLRKGVELRIAETGARFRTGLHGAFALALAPGTYTLEVTDPKLGSRRGGPLAFVVTHPRACPRITVELAAVPAPQRAP